MTLLQKLSNGIYKVKNKAQVVMVDLDAGEQECSASYTDENGKLQSTALAQFIGRL